MTKINELNENELKVLSAVYSVAGNEYNINERSQIEDLLDDNYSWFEARDVIEVCARQELSASQVKGYLSDLEAKGLIANRVDKSDDGVWQGAINQECHEAVLDWLSDEEPVEPRSADDYYQFGYQLSEVGGAYFICVFAVDKNRARFFRMIPRAYAIAEQAKERAQELVHQLTKTDFAGAFNPRDIDSLFVMAGA